MISPSHYWECVQAMTASIKHEDEARRAAIVHGFVVSRNAFGGDPGVRSWGRVLPRQALGLTPEQILKLHEVLTTRRPEVRA